MRRVRRERPVNEEVRVLMVGGFVVWGRWGCERCEFVGLEVEVEEGLGV